MAEKTYNGWTNYETWATNLWLDNDEGSYRYWRRQAADAWTDADKDRDDAIGNLSDTLKSEHNKNAPDVSGVYADLLNAALSEVNWYEIAEHMIDAAAEDDPIEEEEEEEEETEDGADDSEAQS